MSTLPEPIDIEARRRALDLGACFLVSAPAGSGKTELLTQRALACLSVVDDPEEVVAVTFTNKAVNEMRTRIMRALISVDSGDVGKELAITVELASRVLARDKERGWNLLANPSRLRITTIDAFNAFLASQVPLLSGLGGPTRVEPNALALYREAVFRLAGVLEDDSLDPVCRNALEGVFAFAQNRLDRLMPFLTSMLATREQWLPQIFAEAGALLRGEGASQDDSDGLLREVILNGLRSVHEALPADICSMIASAIRLQSHEEALGWAARLERWPDPAIESLDLWRGLAATLLTKDGSLRSRITVRDGFPPKAPATEMMKELLAELHGRADLPLIESSLGLVVSLPDPVFPDDMKLLRGQIAVSLVQLVAHLKIVFQQAGKVDFPEMAMRALAAVDDAEGYAEAKERLDYQIKHLLIDEMQDTSASQLELMRRLTAGWSDGDGRTLFMVGDPKQSIYAFRQAEVSLFERLKAECRFGELALEHVPLSANFRSEVPIVEWCNHTFTQIFPDRTDPFTGAVEYTDSSAHVSESEGDGIVVHGFRAESSLTEAEQVVEGIKQTIRNHPRWTIAVLARARRHVQPVLSLLKKEGIGFACNDIDPLASTDAVRDAHALIRALWHPADRGAWIQLLRAPFVGMSWADIVSLVKGQNKLPLPAVLDNQSVLSVEGRNRLQRLQAALETVDANEVLQGDLARRAEAIWLSLGGPACVTENEAADVGRLFSLLREHLSAGQIEDVHGFELAVSRLYAAPGDGKVQVMTIHKAKGLEFDQVFLVGLGETSRNDDPPLFYSCNLRAPNGRDGFLVVPNPGRRSEDSSAATRLFKYMGRLQSKAQDLEQQRVLYVAATRAKKALHLCIGVQKSEDGSLSPRKRSFAESLWPMTSRQVEAVYGLQDNTEAPAGELIEADVPSAPRIPLEWKLPSPVVSVGDVSSRALPSEQVLQSPAERFEDAALHGLEAMEGTVFHALVARIAGDVSRWSALAGTERREQIRAMSRRVGIPGDALQSSIERVERLISVTLNSKDGQWLLAPRDVAECEFPLVGYFGGRWVSVVLDRCFVEGDDFWVVDYKTPEFAETGSVEQDINTELGRYREQLDRYAETVGRHPIAAGKRIRCALFLASIGRLVEYEGLSL